MEIRWFGQSFFEIVANNETQKGIKIYLDPFDEGIGLMAPKDLEADIVTISHPHTSHNNLKIFKETGSVINTPGEYSVKGIDIDGILTSQSTSETGEAKPNIIFVIESEEIRIAHLGDLGHVLDDSLIQKIGRLDILFLPIGGNNTLNGKEASKVMKQLNPKIVIPMHYKLPGLIVDVDEITNFCNELGICPSEPLRKLIVKQGILGQKELEIVFLEKV